MPRGGARKGAGRPSTNARMVSLKLPVEWRARLDRLTAGELGYTQVEVMRLGIEAAELKRGWS